MYLDLAEARAMIRLAKEILDTALSASAGARPTITRAIECATAAISKIEAARAKMQEAVDGE